MLPQEEGDAEKKKLCQSAQGRGSSRSPGNELRREEISDDSLGRQCICKIFKIDEKTARNERGQREDKAVRRGGIGIAA